MVAAGLSGASASSSSESSRCAVIFVGPPGSGKGTQAALLQKEFGFLAFSTGDELRREIASGSDLGQQIREITEKGELVPDAVVIAMVEKVLGRADVSRILFDGFPRTRPQAEALSALLDLGHWKTKIFYFGLDAEIVVERIAGRFLCKQCKQSYNEKTIRPRVEGVCDVCGGTEFIQREDDKRETVLKRLACYEEMTRPIVDYYKKNGDVVEIDASQEPSSISEVLATSIKSMLQ